MENKKENTCLFCGCIIDNDEIYCSIECEDRENYPEFYEGI